MLSETIIAKLVERFNAPLPEFHKRRIIFWYDENGEFAEQVDDLILPEVKLIKLTGRNNFTVKKLLTIDDLTGDFLIYNPIAYEKPQDNWLIDIELYSGEPFRADLVSMQMAELNIEPTESMKKTVMLYKKFFSKERKEKLREIGRDYHTPLGLHTDVMAVLCGLNGGTAQDVIIAVLSAGLEKESNAALDRITRFGNISVFWQMVQKFTGYMDSDDRPLSELAVHILMTALSQTMNAAALKGLEQYISESRAAYCYQLVHEWQNNEGVNDLYEICRYVESKHSLAERFENLDLNLLLMSDTLPVIDECVLKHIYNNVNEFIIKVDEILYVVSNRRSSAWYNLSANYFDCLYYIAKIQEFYLLHIDGFHIVEPKGLWKFYTSEGYLMDNYYRHFHCAFEKALTTECFLFDDLLKKSAEVVEGLYHQWYLKELTATWTGAIAENMKTLGYVSEITRQCEFYYSYVYITLKKVKRVFVVISDALRYEVAVELAENLTRTTKGATKLESIQARFPGITKFGMAALLPGKRLSVNEQFDVFVDGNATEDTVKRGLVLERANENGVAIAFDKLFNMKKQERRDLVKDKNVVYIYHNTIDATGEKRASESKVGKACAEAINELTGIVRTIVNDLSGTSIIITSDHGFLYTYEPLKESDKISRKAFAGEVYELGRRYALVKPDTTAEYLLPVNMESEIGGVPMKGYTPQDTTRIKVQGGGDRFVHGGVSLQEMVVPVIIYKGMRKDNKRYIEIKNPGLKLVSESRKVANFLFSLDFLQEQAVGEKIKPCVYSLYFIDDQGSIVSDKQTVIADKASDIATERVIRVRFNLKLTAYERNRIYRLVINNDTDDPEEIEFRIDVTPPDDFGFSL